LGQVEASDERIYCNSKHCIRKYARLQEQFFNLVLS